MRTILLNLPEEIFRGMKVSKAKLEADIEKPLTWSDYFKMIYEDYENDTIRR